MKRYTITRYTREITGENYFTAAKRIKEGITILGCTSDDHFCEDAETIGIYENEYDAVNTLKNHYPYTKVYMEQAFIGFTVEEYAAEMEDGYMEDGEFIVECSEIIDTSVLRQIEHPGELSISNGQSWITPEEAAKEIKEGNVSWEAILQAMDFDVREETHVGYIGEEGDYAAFLEDYLTNANSLEYLGWVDDLIIG